MEQEEEEDGNESMLGACDMCLSTLMACMRLDRCRCGSRACLKNCHGARLT